MNVSSACTNVELHLRIWFTEFPETVAKSAEGARPPEAKDERCESFAGGEKLLLYLDREGAHTQTKS